MARRTARQIYVDNTLEILKGHVGHTVGFKQYNVATGKNKTGKGVILRASVNSETVNSVDMMGHIDIFLTTPGNKFPIKIHDWELQGCECGKVLIGTCRVGNK